VSILCVLGCQILSRARLDSPTAAVFLLWVLNLRTGLVPGQLRFLAAVSLCFFRFDFRSRTRAPAGQFSSQFSASARQVWSSPVAARSSLVSFKDSASAAWFFSLLVFLFAAEGPLRSGLVLLRQFSRRSRIHFSRFFHAGFVPGLL
jgi:hypothetical protein